MTVFLRNLLERVKTRWDREDDRKKLFDRVASKGYNLFYFQDFDSNTKVEKISRNDMMNWKPFDIYATPEPGAEVSPKQYLFDENTRFAL